MNITEKEKQHLVDQLEHITGTRPLFYLKFCSCNKFAQDICNGNLYANTADFFRKKESETSNRGQGDQFELLQCLKLQQIEVFDNKTGNQVLTSPNGTFNIQFKNDLLIPIVSFVGIPLRDMNFLDFNNTHIKFTLPFTDSEYEEMSDIFGEYCVILEGKEIENKISNHSKSNGCDYIFDKVDYCNQNRIDRVKSFNTGSKQRFLYKNSDLAYQREYRLALGIEIPNDHFIKLGNFKISNVLKSNELKNLVFSIGYK